MFRKSESPASWSKDFIEHLRSIHFVLIAASISVLVLFRQPNLAEYQKAQSQLERIESFLSAQRKEENDKGQDLALKKTSRQWLEFQAKDGKYLVPYPAAFELVEDHCRNESKLIVFRMPIDTWKSSFASSTNLGEFEGKWDQLSCTTLQSYKPLGVETLDGFRQRIDVARAIVGPSPFRVVVDTEEHLARSNTKTAHLLMWGNLGFPRDIPTEVDFIAPVVADGKKIGDIVVPTSLGASRSVYALFDTQNPEWQCSSTFDECFPELYRVSGIRGRYAFASLQKWINDEARYASPAEFEVVGIKILASDEAYWCTLILLAILFYFWLHLRELIPRIRKGDPGLDVAWVGLYRSHYGIGCVAITLVVLPGLALWLLTTRIVHFDAPMYGFSRNHWFHAACGLTVALATEAFAILSFVSLGKLRAMTQETEPPEPWK